MGRRRKKNIWRWWEGWKVRGVKNVGGVSGYDREVMLKGMWKCRREAILDHSIVSLEEGVRRRRRRRRSKE